MATKVLYYDDSYLLRFTGMVVDHTSLDGRPALALDRSAFYPEGGGQPADHGLLNGVAVVDVQVVDGVIWHIVTDHTELTKLPLGTAVEGEIDRQRRFDHMQQHCGQHILTAAFIAACEIPTVSFHLSEASVTIDLATADLTAAQAQAAEHVANAIIWENRPITARFVTPEELAALPLRKPPSVRDNVRVVTIADFDYSACGGTHPNATGAVGQIRVLGWSRQRGGVRLEFACGERALVTARRVMGAAQAAAATLKLGVDELPSAVERLLTVQKAQSKALEQTYRSLDQFEGERRYAQAEIHGAARVVSSVLDGYSPDRLRTVAQTIAAQPGGVAILGSVADGRAHLAVACAADSGQAAQTLLQQGLPLLDGRGGGNERFAQGGGPQVAALGDALAAIGASL